MHSISDFFDGLDQELIFGRFHRLVANIFFCQIFKLILNTWLTGRKFSREVIRLDSVRDCLPDDWALTHLHSLIALVHTFISLVKVKVRHLVFCIIVLAHLEVLGAVNHHRICARILHGDLLRWALSDLRWNLNLLDVKFLILYRGQQMLRLNVYTIVKNISQRLR